MSLLLEQKIDPPLLALSDRFENSLEINNVTSIAVLALVQDCARGQLESEYRSGRSMAQDVNEELCGKEFEG